MPRRTPPHDPRQSADSGDLLRDAGLRQARLPVQRRQPRPVPSVPCQTATKVHKCGNRTIRADDLCELIDSLVVGMLGDSERLEKVWEQGSDSADELAELDELLADLTDQLGTGLFKRGTPPQRQRLEERIRAAAERRDELASQPSKPSGWQWVSTGEPFGPWWASQDANSRNAWLRSAGVRVEFDRENIRIDLGDLQSMLGGWQPVPRLS